MRSKTAIFVDAGYLIAAMASRLTGSSLRRGITVNYQQVVDSLVDLVDRESGLPLLRVYWYDAARNGVLDTNQEAIAALPRVKVRLGRTGVDGEQKGVDLRIGLDMVGHSRDGVVDSIYLVSGDDDLTEAVEEAQAKGVQVTVLAVPDSTGKAHGVSRHLTRAADGVLVLDGEHLDTCAKPSMAAFMPTPGAPMKSKSKDLPRSPSPADLASRVAGPAPAPTSTIVYSSGSRSPRYVDSTYSVGEDELQRKIESVVEKAYQAWSSSYPVAQRREKLALKPMVPSDLDRAMLLDLADALDNYNLGDDIRVRLRSELWRLVDEEG